MRPIIACLIIVALLLTVVALGGCGKKGEGKKPAAEEAQKMGKDAMMQKAKAFPESPEAQQLEQGGTDAGDR